MLKVALPAGLAALAPALDSAPPCFANAHSTSARRGSSGTDRSAFGNLTDCYAQEDHLACAKGAALSSLRICRHLWNMQIHQSVEAIVMVAHKKVHKLVDDDVFEALGWHLGQLQVQPSCGSGHLGLLRVQVHHIENR